MTKTLSDFAKSSFQMAAGCHLFVRFAPEELDHSMAAVSKTCGTDLTTCTFVSTPMMATPYVLRHNEDTDEWTLESFRSPASPGDVIRIAIHRIAFSDVSKVSQVSHQYFYIYS